MQVFKLCLCKIARNPLFFIVYVVGLSFMGLAMAAGLTLSQSMEDFERQSTQFAVIDRDDSELSRGVVAYLETQGQRQPVGGFGDRAARCGSQGWCRVHPYHPGRLWPGIRRSGGGRGGAGAFGVGVQLRRGNRRAC